MNIVILSFFITLNTYLIGMIAFMIAYTLDTAVPNKAFWFNTIQNGVLFLVAGFVVVFAIVHLLFKFPIK